MSEETPFLPTERPRVDLRGIRVGAVGSALAFLVVLLVAEILAFLSPDPGNELSVLDTVKTGVLLFFGFHHVGIRAEFAGIDFGGIAGGGPPAGLPGLGGLGFSFTVALAMLLATVLALWLLYRAGRSAAAAGGGTLRDRLLLGASAAVPYAALSLLFSLLVRFSVEAPAEAGLSPGATIDISASPPAALFWPLLLGALAGVLGGLAAGRDLLEVDRVPRWGLALLHGAGRMLAAGAFGGAIVLFVLAAANPGAFTAYWRGVAEAGTLGGLQIVVFTALLAPNLIVFLGFLGMGGSLAAQAAGTSVSASLFSFPPLDGLSAAVDPFAPGAALPGAFQTGAAPIEWWASILIPLVAVLWGGRWAARRVATTRGEAAAAGALAGAVFALAMLGLAILAGIGIGADLNVFLQVDYGGRVGPALVLGTVLALAWGAGGGALGGLLGARPVAPPAPPPE